VARSNHVDPALAERRYQPGTQYSKFSTTADRDLLIQPRNEYSLSDLIVRVVEAEGPIHEGLLAERLKEICGVDRAGSNVQSNIGEAVQSAVRRRRIERRRQKDFLWTVNVQLRGSEFQRTRIDDHWNGSTVTKLRSPSSTWSRINSAF
jgi:hypothetical protein